MTIKSQTLISDTDIKLTELISTLYNVMLLAFYRAIDQSKTIFDMVNGFMDEYEDESGIDTGTSVNQSYNSTDDYYTPAITEVVDQQQTVSDNNASFGDISDAEYRNAQGFQLSGAKTVTAIELYINSKSGSPTGNWTIRIETNNAGVPSGTLANVNASVVVASIDSGTLKATFATPFALSASTTYWIVVLCDNQSTNNNWQMARQITTNLYANGTSATSTNGGSTWSANVNWDLKFKVYVQATTKENMILISNVQIAATVPTSARLVMFEEDVDAITLNTDLKAYISRDNGTTWSQTTLTNEGYYATSKNILSGLVDISSQPSGSNVKYKIETLNNKNLKIHGTGINWS